MDLLRQWLNQNGDDQQLQQLAKEDPFLADALEGYQQFPQDSHAPKLNHLRNRLRQRYQKRESKRVALWYASRAAAVLAFVGLLSLIWYLNQTPIDAPVAEITSPTTTTIPKVKESPAPEAPPAIEEEPELRGTKPQAPATTPAPPKPNSPTASTKDNAPPPPPAIAPQEDGISIVEQDNTTSGNVLNDQSIQQLPEKDITDLVDVYSTADEETPILIEQDNTTSGRTATEQQIRQLPTKADAPPPLPPPAKASKEIAEADMEDNEVEEVEMDKITIADASTKEDEARSSSEISSKRRKVRPQPESLGPPYRIIKGVVKDEIGEPLVGVTIVISGKTEGTVTNYAGRFKLTLPSQTEYLELNYVGYASQQLYIKDQDYFDVTLIPEERIQSEVVVADRGKLAKTNGAKPVGGFQKLERYIKKSLRFPPQARENKITGEVELTFYVKADGQLRDIRVTKSLGYGCDQEAIRLLREGPKWMSTGLETELEAKYSILFE